MFLGTLSVALYTSLMNSSHYCNMGFHSQPSRFPCPLPRAACCPGLPALVASNPLPPVKCTSVNKMGETSINLNYTGSSPVVEDVAGGAEPPLGAQEMLPLNVWAGVRGVLAEEWGVYPVKWAVRTRAQAQGMSQHGAGILYTVWILAVYTSWRQGGSDGGQTP